MFKRRNIIAFILTIAIVALLNKYWLFFKPNHSLPQFNFYILIILLILIYLLMYKLTDYIADFKTVKKYSRVDIIFLTIFSIFLFIPSIKIEENNIQLIENRAPTEWKPFIENNKINYDFGKNFNEWYNDRFFLRNQLNNIYGKIKYFLSGDIYANEFAVYNKKTKWCFSKNFLENGKSFIHFESKQKILNNLIKFGEFCKSHNIKLYVLIVPTSSDIYGEQAGVYYSKKYKEDVKNLSHFFQTAKDVKIIYPYNELEKLKNGTEPIFYKQDAHWTQYSTYLTYTILMNEIKKDFPNIKIQNLSDYNVYYSPDILLTTFEDEYKKGGAMRYVPFIEQDKSINYKYFKNKSLKKLSIETTNIERKKQQIYFYPNGSDLRVLQIGTSMNKNLLNFTPYSFKNLKHIRLNVVKGIKSEDSFKIMKYYKDEILNYKPDIIIFCIATINLAEVVNIFEE